MTLNRILTAAGAAMLGLTVASGAVNASTITDVGLGFGKFLGTWKNDKESPDDPATMPNPSENTDNPSDKADNVTQVGSAILFRYPGSFPLNEFNLAGAIDGYGTALNNSNSANTGFRIESDGSAHTAKWNYYGFPGDAIPDVSPGMEPTELYVAVKYGDYTSVFLYGVVNPGQFGYVTSDFAEILGHTNSVDYDYGALNYTGLDGECSVTVYSPTCMPYAGNAQNNAHGISHVTAYWPPLDVPEPASVTLLGAGLLGLGYIRRRKAA